MKKYLEKHSKKANKLFLSLFSILPILLSGCAASGGHHSHTAGNPVEENRVEATCTESGSYDLVTYCSVDNVELSRIHKTIPAPGHSFDDWCIDINPTCTASGKRHRTCTKCDYVENEIIQASGHIVGNPVEENRVEATCTEDGSYDLVTYCSVDNVELSRIHKTIPAPGHDYGEFVIDNIPTETENGSKHRTCSRCGHIDHKTTYATGTIDKLSFTFDADEHGYIASPKDEYVSGKVVVPHYYNNYPVVSVRNFNKCSLITSITLPDTINYSGFTFEDCIGLEEVVLPESLYRINDYMFYNCINLKEVSFSSDLVSIGRAAFYKCSLVSIVLPDSLTTIGRDAFRDCTKLETVHIDKNASDIDERAFDFSSDVRGVLREVNVDPDNEYYCSVDGVLYNKDKTVLLYCPNGKDGNLIIPNTVSAIGAYSFRCCNKITSIYVPDGLLIIKEAAFHDFGNYGTPYNTITIDLPNTIKAIESFGFCRAHIVVIHYRGTMEEWNKVILGENWNTATTITIECSDGVIQA